MKINRDSWHYKLLCAYRVYSNAMFKFGSIERHLEDGHSIQDIFEIRSGQRFDGDWKFVAHWIRRAPSNACQYLRQAFLFPLLFSIINLSVLSIMVTLVLINPVVILGSLLIIVGVAIAIAIALSISFLLMFKESPLVQAVKQFVTNDNTLLAAAYDKYKNNVCTLIEVEVKKND